MAAPPCPRCSRSDQVRLARDDRWRVVTRRGRVVRWGGTYTYWCYRCRDRFYRDHGPPIWLDRLLARVPWL